ncbi:hypothetical protein HG530_006635 [Fusarium avenaceum]|nr:hypothetical protein HG530_006635 [Fusarium avenaceum]
MCYQITEYYSACRCVYYIHPVDLCATFDQPGHGVQKRKILVGYACSSHPSFASSHLADDNTGIGAGDTLDDDDHASVFSDISAPSTNLTFPDDTKQEATDRLFQELLNEFSLRHLWPQIVRICHHKDQATKSIARYLSCLSHDLRTEATTRLPKNAAGFVRIARLTIADRIVECHVNELAHKDDWALTTTAKEALLDKTVEGEQTEDLDTEEKNIVYENIQQFIFEGAPFQSFILALRLFASSNTESTKESSHNARQYFNYLFQKRWKGPAAYHRTRLS